jgi:DNA polymerase-1
VVNYEWGVHLYGAKLYINRWDLFNPAMECSFDVETNGLEGADCIVLGCSVVYNDKEVFYFTKEHMPRLTEALRTRNLITFNAKGDVRWMDLDINRVIDDVMLMSYVHCSTKKSQSLKDIAFNEFGARWPTYKEMIVNTEYEEEVAYWQTVREKLEIGKLAFNRIIKVAKTRNLEFQTVEKVANYCGMDAFMTFLLRNHYRGTLDGTQKRFYQMVELPVMKVCKEMEDKGVMVNVDRANELGFDFTTRANAAKVDLFRIAEGEFNPNSPDQVLELLTGKFRLKVKGTRKEDLQPHQAHVFVNALQRYRAVAKLLSTYTTPLAELAMQDPTRRIHANFNQIAVQDTGEHKGIRTGRFSSSDPNLQNIPSRSELGKLLRTIFVAQGKHAFVNADYSQIEYRILAHITGEPVLVEAFLAGRDAHQETGDLLGLVGKTAKETRHIGKTINFAAIYGAFIDKIAFTTGLPRAEAERIFNEYWVKLPRVLEWKMDTLRTARREGGVRTMFGRFIDIADLSASNKYLRGHAERQAINYIVQGSAADVIKMAMNRIRRYGLVPVLQVHDELMYEVPEEQVSEVIELVGREMRGVLTMKVPLAVEPWFGKTWAEAKGE